MGGALQPCTPYRDRTALVKAHLYDLGKPPAGPDEPAFIYFQVTLEVFGKEWSYKAGEGIFSRDLAESAVEDFKDAERLGRTEISQRELEALVAGLSTSWSGSSYNTLTKNSAHFCNELCDRLGVDSVSDIFARYASQGARVDEHVSKVATDVRAAAGAAAEAMATKVTELQTQYQIKDTATAHVEKLKEKANELDSKLGLSATKANIAAKATDLDDKLGLSATKASLAAKATDLDAKLGITAATAGVATKVQGLAAQAADNARDSIQKGKEARGAQQDDNYQFGDLTRGIMETAWSNTQGAGALARSILPAPGAASGNSGAR